MSDFLVWEDKEEDAILVNADTPVDAGITVARTVCKDRVAPFLLAVQDHELVVTIVRITRNSLAINKEKK